MTRRSSFPKPHTIDLRGVLGTFKVPNAKLTVEYFLTYASLDASEAAYGQLLDLLVPVREVFELQDLNFDQLLQRDLDDFRVSNEMVPYLLGYEPSDPRFFPPIVSVIVPTTNGKMENHYPVLKTDSEQEAGFELEVSKFGNVFSVKREVNDQGHLARSPVDFVIYPANARLVIVDGQHRAMAMLATYRSAFNKWSGNPFKYFYEKLNNLEDDNETSVFSEILLPICIVYFPELTKGDSKLPDDMNLTNACRKLFLDVNRNARQPSQARQILLDDTDLAAFYTRFIFNKFQENNKSTGVRLYHTEYDNPHDRVVINRPFAITDVYTIFTIVQNVLMLDDARVRNAMSGSGKQPQNTLRLHRELELEDYFTQEELDRLIVKRYNYSKSAEDKLGECFDNGWGISIVETLDKFYPYSKHIEAVNKILKQNEPYIGPNAIAHTALVEGQGLRFTLEKQQEQDKKYRKDFKVADKTDAEKAWNALTELESQVEKLKAKLYLPIKRGEPSPTQIEKTNRIFLSFRTNAFQTGVFMAFAYLKAKLSLDNQEFVTHTAKWIERLNRRFQTDEKVRTILFDVQEPNSLRRLFKPAGGLTPNNWDFFRYVILELLRTKTGKEKGLIDEAVVKWRGKLYQAVVARKRNELGDDDTTIDSKNLAFEDMIRAYRDSLGISKKEIEDSIRKFSRDTEEFDETAVFPTDDEEAEELE